MLLPKLYPRANATRQAHTKEEIHKLRKHFYKAVLINFGLLQVLFLCLFCYIFGALFEQPNHVHNMQILYVDYDGGAVGSSVREAYGALKSKGFPTLYEEPASQFPTVPDIRDAVCETRYWAAIFTFQGASDRLEDALGGGSAASSYNRSDAMAFIWNEAIYSTVVDSAIEGSLQKLSLSARLSYLSGNGTATAQALNANDSAAVSVFADPWELLDIDIQTTAQGSRLIYNTLVVILVMIQEFFYLGTVNGLFGQFKIYSTFYPLRLIIVRNLISAAYCLIGSLCTSGAIYAFRAGWNINGSQFVLMWMTFWLFAHVNFITLDVFTIWLPPPFVPMALIAWLVFNVTSILLPYDLMPAFYRWSYLLPTHEVYQVLVDIWSRGCNPHLHYALPILFAMEVVSLVISSIGVYRRAHYAMLAVENAEDAVQARVDAAVTRELERHEAQREKERERAELARATEPVEQRRLSAEAEEEEEEREDEEGVSDTEREELEQIATEVRRVDTRLSRQRTEQSRKANFGPAFGLPFGGPDEDDK